MALLAASNLALVAIWAANGYEETWFYATLILMTVPTGWIHFIGRGR